MRQLNDTMLSTVIAATTAKSSIAPPLWVNAKSSVQIGIERSALLIANWRMYRRRSSFVASGGGRRGLSENTGAIKHRRLLTCPCCATSVFHAKRALLLVVEKGSGSGKESCSPWDAGRRRPGPTLSNP
jgi:hypothetical protein